MKKIGFIDYRIDEWHANNYPQWIRESSRKEDFDLVYAWQEEAQEGLRSLEEWCKDFKATPASSIEQVVEESDGIIVLAPSNPEVHERLAEIPLQSGKPVYIDKPFAPDKATAERLFAKAEKHGTPLFSSSALRFGAEIQQAVNETFKDQTVEFAISAGGGTSFEEYSIHQIEMLVMMMGEGAERVMQCGSTNTSQMIIDYGSGRRCTMNLVPDHGFQLSAYRGKDTVIINSMEDFFPGLIEAILQFFDTKCPPVSQKETIEIVHIMETGIQAQQEEDCWFNLA